MLCATAGVSLVRRSSDYLTPPWGVTDQPAFVNLCIEVATTLSPRALLVAGLAIEWALGRDRARERHWGPRAIDIDLIAYDDVTLCETGLTLPHPLWRERAFVVVPLAEIVPDRCIAGTRVADALSELDVSRIERLAPRAI